MQNENERISQFINLVAPFVCVIVSTMIRILGCQLSHRKSGINTVFTIKAGDKEIELYLQNLLFEIVTVDRDAKPLVFDEKILEPEIFLDKTFGIVASKLKVLLYLLSEEDAESAINKITQDSKNYERIRIIRFDRNPQRQDNQ